MKTLTDGAQAPDFELPDENGRPVRLSERLQDGPVVLFFYPGAMTGGCTKEACHFRDLATEFKEAGAQRLGISTDPVARQKQFTDLHGFDYPLLSDESGEVAVAYGVRRRLITPVKRATFVIDPDRTIRKVVASELSMDVHADQALAALREG
ncbi:peroxiredoxin [Nocardioides mesophilus]|uniref:thioredoxin-dependent peroxiredoxin n=1 Tax=Nocardioides mesophilus TaxID=433659 RepID=A0A7G9RB60_9ACTN|nr:peroxiredoxin [Nocardioides mesophilus]QNN52835.1 peroxiredoxin [Nocardioides mesophilus]